MRKIISGKNGQALVITIGAVLVLFMLFIAVVETGNLMYEKVHTQNAADSAAMEAGLWYARSMNLASLSNKVLSVAALAGVIGTLLGAPELLEGVDRVMKLQDCIIGTGDFQGKSAMAWLSAGMAFYNGQQNGTMVVPLFNSADCPTFVCMPTLNVERSTLEAAAEEGEDIKYYYTKKRTGERVYVDTQDTVLDPTIKNRPDMESRVKAKENIGEASNKYLQREKQSVSEKIPFLLKESSEEHSVLIICWKQKQGQLLKTGLLKDKDGNDTAPALMPATSFVRVGGGNMDLFDLNGANYGAKIEHVKLPRFEGLDKAGDVLSKLPGETDGTVNLDVLGKGLEFVEENLILH